MKVQSLWLSSIIFLFPLMFSLGGCNYLEKCKHGDMEACKSACKDKETCTKACGEGNIYACALVCDEYNQFACTKACFDIDEIMVCKEVTKEDYNECYMGLRSYRKSACKSLCENNDWNACDVIINNSYIDTHDDVKRLCEKGHEPACSRLCVTESFVEEPAVRGVCRMLCDTTYNCSLHSHDTKIHEQACELLENIKKRQEEEQRRDEIYQKSHRGKCEKNCNDLYQKYSEMWNFCMESCKDLRSDI